MSKSAFSAKVFAVYLFIAGALLATVPNVLLSILFIPQTSEVWIRVIGVIAVMIGIYAWDAATHEARSFFCDLRLYTVHRVRGFLGVRGPGPG